MLILPIKKKWYDMILSGKKKEEYREIKPYYTTRFQTLYGNDWDKRFERKREVLFRNGYSADSPSFVARVHIKIDKGNPDWGAEPGVLYYCLCIDEINVVHK